MAEYPSPKFRFWLEWNGSKVGFNEVTGLEVETEMIEYRHGESSEDSKLQLPGLSKYAKITLKRGMLSSDNEFVDWWKSSVLPGEVERRDVTISLLNEAHEPVMTWLVKQAWPTKVTATDLKSGGNEVAIESMELAHEGLVIQSR
jgi:phage tail-like protein